MVSWRPQRRIRWGQRYAGRLLGVCGDGRGHPVESMLDYLAAGDSIHDLLVEFPDLEREDLLACLHLIGSGSAARRGPGRATAPTPAHCA
jgi:uncharacterized protein (DUF433 family)